MRQLLSILLRTIGLVPRPSMRRACDAGLFNGTRDVNISVANLCPWSYAYTTRIRQWQRRTAAFYRTENRTECSHACGDASGYKSSLSSMALANCILSRSLMNEEVLLILLVMHIIDELVTRVPHDLQVINGRIYRDDIASHFFISGMRISFSTHDPQPAVLLIWPRSRWPTKTFPSKVTPDAEIAVAAMCGVEIVTVSAVCGTRRRVNTTLENPIERFYRRSDFSHKAVFLRRK